MSDERVILIKVADGDEQAFAELAGRYRNTIYSHALAYSKSHTKAEEITQDVLLRVWNKKEKLKVVENFKSYLFILAKNQIISALRTRIEKHDLKDLLDEPVIKPDEELQRKQLYEALMKAIDKLPPARKTVFKLSRLEGLTYEEIGTRLNITRNTVKEHIVKSLVFLRAELGHLLPLLIFLNIF